MTNCDWNLESYTRLCSESCPGLTEEDVLRLALSNDHVTIRRGKRLSFSNSTVFTDTVVLSRCHRTTSIIQYLHDGIGRVAFLKQSGSLLFPSFCLREAKNARWRRWSHEVKTKMTQFDKIHDCLSKGKMDTRIQHENEPSQGPSAFLACQRFATAHEVAA